MREKISSSMFRIALVFILIAMVECRNDFFSKLQERRNTKKNLEMRQEDTAQGRQQSECNQCISVIEQNIQTNDKICSDYFDEAIEYDKMPDPCNNIDEDDVCWDEVFEFLYKKCEDQCDQCINAIDQIIQTDNKLCNCYSDDCDELYDLMPSQCDNFEEDDFCSDQDQVSNFLLSKCEDDTELKTAKDKKQNQMCEIVDCRYPMAQLLCDECKGEDALNSECDDPETMVACIDGSCITSDGVCDGINTCNNPDDLDYTEDEYGCLEMQDSDASSEEDNEDAE